MGFLAPLFRPVNDASTLGSVSIPRSSRSPTDEEAAQWADILLGIRPSMAEANGCFTPEIIATCARWVSP